MPTDAISLALFIIEEGIKHEPEIQAIIVSFFSKKDPTPEDWAALRAAVVAMNYRTLVPHTQLPPQA